MTNLAGQVALITGASRGIGADTARCFAQAGAKVVLLARSGAQIDALAAEIGSAALAIKCDVSSYTDMERAFEQAKAHFGPVTILINNAGVIAPISHLSHVDPKEWTRAIDINLTGVFNGMRCALAGMMEARCGTIITVSSGAAHFPIEGWSHYCSSKAGAAMLTACAHGEAGVHGVRIMGMSPGTVATQMQREIKASGINPVSQLAWEDHIPADWPARAMLWMCSAQADDLLGTEVSLRDTSILARAGLT